MNSTHRIAYLQGFYQAYGMNKEAQNLFTLEDFGGHPPGKDWDMGNLTDEQTQTTRKWDPSISWVGEKSLSPEEIARRNQGLDDMEIAAKQGVPYAQQYLERNQRPPRVYKPVGAVSHAFTNPIDFLYGSPEYQQIEADRVRGEIERAKQNKDIDTLRMHWVTNEKARPVMADALNKLKGDQYAAETAKQKSRLKNWAIGAGTTAAIGIPLAMLMAQRKKTDDPRIADLAKQLLSSKRTGKRSKRSIDYDSEGNVIVKRMKATRLSKPSTAKPWYSRLPSAAWSQLTGGIKDRANPTGEGTKPPEYKFRFPTT